LQVIRCCRRDSVCPIGHLGTGQQGLHGQLNCIQPEIASQISSERGFGAVLWGHIRDDCWGHFTPAFRQRGLKPVEESWLSVCQDDSCYELCKLFVLLESGRPIV